MKTMNWKDAIEFCKNLNYAGHNDWRLPTIEELLTLVDRSKYKPALPAGHPFLSGQSSYYWSGSTYAYGTNYAWYVFMDYGFVYNDYKTSSYYVWPVRSGQYDEFGDLLLCRETVNRFTDNGDGTVADNRSGLVWIKDLGEL